MNLPWRHQPIRDDQPHHGWRDGTYRDDEGIYWRLTPPVIGQGVWVPDRNDAATCGVLLAAVREAHKDPDLHISVAHHDGSRHVHRRGRDGDNRGMSVLTPKWTLVGSGPTDWDALVDALHGAPVRA